MSDLIIVGTDTDAGKTTLALLWLAAFGDQFEYWKPLESGASDSQEIRTRLPAVVVHPPLHSFREAVAPPLAARWEGMAIPSACQLWQARPKPTDATRSLLIETFGSPLSPLNEQELQVAFLQASQAPVLLVTSSAVGAIGRTLQCLVGLETHGIPTAAAVLLGERDDYAVEQIQRQKGDLAVFSLPLPTGRSEVDLRKHVEQNRRAFDEMLRQILTRVQSVHLPSPPVLGGRGVGGEGGFAAYPPHPRPLSPEYGGERSKDAVASKALPEDQTARARLDLLERDRAVLWHPYSPLRSADDPLLVIGAKDEFLHLADGSQLIDGISSWWTILHGHRHPVLVNAWREAIARIDHVHFAGVTHPWGIELAELLLQSAPWKGGRVFYSDNGSTAVEVALKMAYQFWRHRGEPQRTRFIGFEHGYHGDTFGAMAVSRDPLFFGSFEPLLFQADIVPLDLDQLHDALAKRPGQVAAVIVEPLVQGAGGMRMHSPETLRALAEVAARHDTLFIADEVMTGGGRTGTLWAFQAADIAPDLICAAKTLAGGMLPIAATLASPRIVAAFDSDDRRRTFFHGHSFTGHPVACAIGVANWRFLTSQPLVAPARIETFWRRRLQSFRSHPRVRDVRIRGLIAAVELDAEGGYLAEAGLALRQFAVSKGVLLRPLGNVLYALPPFCTSEDSLERIAEVMEGALNELR